MAQSKQAKKIQIEVKGKKKKSSVDESIHNVIGYNVKLRKKEVIQDPRRVTTKNGKPAIKGHGSDGTGMMRFIKAS